MKVNSILGSLVIIILLMSSCKKTENPEPQMSDAVKEYFGLVVEATYMTPPSPGNSNTTGALKLSDNYQLGPVDKNKLKSSKNDDCEVEATYEVTDTTFYMKSIYSSCSGREGYHEAIWHFFNNNYKETCDICYLEDYYIGKTGCQEETREEGFISLADGTKFYKKEMKFTKEGTPDFEHKIDAIFTIHSAITFEYYDKFSGETKNATYNYERGTETSYSEIIKKENVYNCINLEPIAYEYGVEYVVSEVVNSDVDSVVIPFLVEYKVSGSINVEYERGGESGEFIIDYGTGNKDHIATITENGVSYEINYKELIDSLREEWNTYMLW